MHVLIFIIGDNLNLLIVTDHDHTSCTYRARSKVRPLKLHSTLAPNSGVGVHSNGAVFSSIRPPFLQPSALPGPSFVTNSQYKQEKCEVYCNKLAGCLYLCYSYNMPIRAV